MQAECKSSVELVLKTICFTILCLFVTKCHTSVEKTPDYILLQDQGTKSVNVPTKGPYSNETSTRAATILYELSYKGVSWENELQHLPVEKQDLLTQAFHDMYGDAVEKIDLAIRVAGQTSGPVDEKLSKAALKIAEKLLILIKKKPSKIRVTTWINTSNPHKYIRYMLLRDVKRRLENWSSYTFGDVIKIGYYRFEALGSNNDIVAREDLLILDDPTHKKQLLPVRNEY